jgi:hypothetical protein
VSRVHVQGTEMPPSSPGVLVYERHSVHFPVSHPVNLQTNPAALSNSTFRIVLSTVTNKPLDSSHVHVTNIFEKKENKMNQQKSDSGLQSTFQYTRGLCIPVRPVMAGILI